MQLAGDIEIAGVGRDADESAIKSAYRKAALRLHPDKCQLDGSKEAFRALHPSAWTRHDRVLIQRLKPLRRKAVFSVQLPL